MGTLEERIKAFVELGQFLSLVNGEQSSSSNYQNFRKEDIVRFQQEIENAQYYNAWFTPDNIRVAISGIQSLLKQDKLENWLNAYPQLTTPASPKQVGVVMAGNIPLVGFHDILCILLSGHQFIGKTSSKDQRLPRLLAETLQHIHPPFRDYIHFQEGFMKTFDAIIATGSNNTSRYFEYYFGNYPHIIRTNRNGVAVLTGEESTEQLQKLADDIFLYFGLGCRNVTKLYLPQGYTFQPLFEALHKYQEIINHHKYANNYQYYRSIYLLNQIKHYDTGFLIVKEDDHIASPIGTIHFQYYNDKQALKNHLTENREAIQCIVSDDPEFSEAVPLGKSQFPEPWDYADNIDTVNFLTNL